MINGDAVLAAVMRASLDAIIVMDERGCIEEFNPAAEAMFGQSRAEVLGHPVLEVIGPPHARQRQEEGFRQLIRGASTSVLGRRVEVEGLRADGLVFPVELAMVETHGPDGRLLTACLRDRTESRSLHPAFPQTEPRLATFRAPGPVGLFVGRRDRE